MAARAARHDAYLRARADEKEQRTRERLKLVAPGFEPSAGPLIPTRTSLPSQQQEGQDARTREKDVMDELVEQLAKMESREEKPS